MGNLTDGLTRGALTLALLVGGSACSGSDGGGGDGGGSQGGAGTVTEAWRSYCTATFTEDYRVEDVFDEPLFTARSGDEYLMGAYDTTFGDVATLYYLTSHGPYAFDIEASAESGEFPFVSNCEIGAALDYYAAFDDVAVFQAEDLATKICDLSAGSVLPRAASGSGYGIASEFSLTGPATYEVMLNAFSAQCGGAERGYVSVPQIEVLGFNTWIVPIQSVIGPP